MAADLPLDLDPGARLEPGFEDGRRRAPVPGRQVDDDLILVDAPDPLDAGTASAWAGRLEAEPVEVAAEADPRAVPKAAPGSELGSVASVTVQVTAEPRLAFDEEGTDMSLRIRPAAATGRRNGHDHAAVGMDDDPQAAGSGRAAERVVEWPSGQAHDRGGLGNGHGPDGATAASWVRRRRQRSRQARRSSRPGRSPVSAPWRIAGRPLTMTCSMPAG